MSFLDLARRLRETETSCAGGIGLESAPLVEVRERIAAVRVRSPMFGDVWLALDPGTAAALVAEEPGIPVLQSLDVARLRGKSPEMVRAILATLAVFPETHLVQ